MTVNDLSIVGEAILSVAFKLPDLAVYGRIEIIMLS